jgi:putative nucleotidyltransferase with HDIG domain
MPEKTKTRTLIPNKSSRKAEREARPRSKGRIQESPWVNPEVKRWLILFCLSAVISLLLFPNILIKPVKYNLGDVADRDIKASHEFLVEDNELTEKNRQESLKAVLSVYDFDPSAANVVAGIREAFAAGREYCNTASLDLEPAPSPLLDEKKVKGPPSNPGAFESRFFETLDLAPDDSVFEPLKKAGFPAEVEESIIRLVTQVLKKGVVGNKAMLLNQSGKGIVLHDIQSEKEMVVTDLSAFYNLKGARAHIRGESQALDQSLMPPELKTVALKLSADLTKPNLTFNKRETELRKDLARKSVKPFYFKVKKGEMLVREGERIRPEHLLKLSAQAKSLKHKEMLGRVPAMALLIGFLLAAMYLGDLMVDRSSRNKTKDLLFTVMTLLTTFLLVIASGFVAEEIARGFYFFSSTALLFVIPVASGAMLLSVFQGMQVGVTFSLLASVLASLAVGGRVEFFLYFFISSLIGAYGVRNCRERGIFIKTGLRVGLTNLMLALAIEALYGTFYSLEAVVASVGAFVGGILVGVIATGILPLIEMAFGYTTDIKLLELANLDQPLLRELMVQAPGTYHHSVIVSNLVEATAKAVNANPLLAKTAAYYHDIGKMKKPLYFIENQMGGQNRHEKLAPSMSSLILISHVKDGVELAQTHKLGGEITDIIRQHHGTSLISFFYQKAKEQADKKGGKSPTVKEEDFRYPGPKPQTKEAGLVMLADAVEAASRTIADCNVARIQGLVQKMINKVFSDGQLDECELTLKDLHEIAKSFHKTLSGIYHHRVEYPESAAKISPVRKGTNGNSDHNGSGDAWPRKPEDKAEVEESLKRLGLS